MQKPSRNSANIVDCQVGARLRERRRAQKMTQAALGKHLGISFQQIQKYEAGTNRIGASNLYKLATALDVPVQYFYKDVFPNAPELASDETDAELRSILDFVRTSEGRALYAAFVRIPNVQARRHMIELIKTMAQPEKV